MKKIITTIAALFALTSCSPVIEHLLQVDAGPNQPTRSSVTLTPIQLAYLATHPAAGSPNGPPLPSEPAPGSPNAP